MFEHDYPPALTDNVASVAIAAQPAARPRLVKPDLWKLEQKFLGDRHAVYGKTEDECYAKMKAKKIAIMEQMVRDGKLGNSIDKQSREEQQLMKALSQAEWLYVQACAMDVNQALIREKVIRGIEFTYSTRQIETFLEAYWPALVARKKKDDRREQYAKRDFTMLQAILAKVGIKHLADLADSAGKFEDYLLGMNAAPGTKRKHHSIVSKFADWLVHRCYNGVTSPLCMRHAHSGCPE